MKRWYKKLYFIHKCLNKMFCLDIYVSLVFCNYINKMSQPTHYPDLKLVYLIVIIVPTNSARKFSRTRRSHF